MSAHVQSPSLQSRIEEIASRRGGRLDGELRRRRVLAVALIECGTVGIAGLSMARIAKRAGVSTATLYRDFSDKDALIAAAAHLVIPLLAEAMSRSADLAEPRERAVAMLKDHAAIFAEPFLGPLLRAYVGQEGGPQPGTVRLARAGRDVIEAFWNEQITRLEAEGAVSNVDRPHAINFLLGAVERPTVLGRLLFGEDDGKIDRDGCSAKTAAAALFALYPPR